MMKMDVRGQISVELVLIVGIIVVIVLVFASFLGDQNEQNNIASATRMGAVNATTQLGLLNRTSQPVRVNGISMTENTSTNTINLNIALSNVVSDSNSRIQILNSTNQSIAAQGYQPNYNGNDPNQFTFNTTRHKYTILLT